MALLINDVLVVEFRPEVLKFYIVLFIESTGQMLFDLVSKKDRFFDYWLVEVIGVLEINCCC